MKKHRRTLSLKTKSILILSAIFIICSAIITNTIYFKSKDQILKTLKQSGEQSVMVHSKDLSTWVSTRVAQVEVIANTELVSSMNYDKIIPYFQKEVQKYDSVYNSFGISDTKGKLTLQNGVVVDISTESTFPEVLGGKKIISNPFPDKQNEKDWIISMECPVRDASNNVIGLVSGASLVSKVFEDTTNFHLGKTDKVFILHKDGTVLYHPDPSLINKQNLLKSGSDNYKRAVENILNKVSNSETVYENNVQHMLFAYPVQNTEWVMFLDVPVSEYTSELTSLMYLAFAITGASALIFIIVIFFLSNYLFRRISLLSVASKGIAEGNLSCHLEESKDELGTINGSFNRMVESLSQIIGRVNAASNKAMENADKYSQVSDQVAQFGKDVRNTMDELTGCSQDTANNVSHIANSVGNMQNSVKELIQISNTIESNVIETQSRISESSETLRSAEDQIQKMKENIINSSEEINELDKKSQQIVNITTTISNIAKQTNLLALNASIEAARAGENGKGFSVVAEEIRKLAEQAAVSSKEISEVINEIQTETNKSAESMKQSINYMNAGTMSIGTIVNTFNDIVHKIDEIRNVSDDVAKVANVLSGENDIISQTVETSLSISEVAASKALSASAVVIKQDEMLLQLKTSSKDLIAVVDELMNTISKFKL